MAEPTNMIASIAAGAAQDLVAGAVAKAVAINRPMAIAVCDQAGELKAFLRMDGAPLIASNIAKDKAYTSAASQMPTHEWHELIKDDPPLAAGMPVVPRMVVFGGGFPVLVAGACVGAIGVSGGHYSEDMAVGRDALARLD
jgi:uncharacterized protein GlcG (DUF336 family)